MNPANSDDWDTRDLGKYSYIGDSFQYTSDNPKEGWYVYPIEKEKDVRLDFMSADNNYITWIKHSSLSIRFFDRFLYLDGQVFDFSEYRMTYDFDFREESTTLSDGTPAKVFTHELKANYLGRDYYEAIVDTVYQLPK